MSAQVHFHPNAGAVCLNAACARATPHAVRFCPYCGVAQQGAHAAPATAPASPAPDAAPAPTGAAPPAAAIPVAPPAPAKHAPRNPAGATPATPPQRAPLHWFWWLLGLALLWMAWVKARPDTQQYEGRIAHAIALAQDCKARDAQSELIALRDTHATPAQLRRLQTALNDAASQCDRARPKPARRERAASAATPPADPARQLIAEAERDIARANYRGAIDKMDTCVAMADAGNRECAALKARAERLYQGR